MYERLVSPSLLPELCLFIFIAWECMTLGFRVGPEKNLSVLPLTFREGPNRLSPLGYRNSRWSQGLSLLWAWLQLKEQRPSWQLLGGRGFLSRSSRLLHSHPKSPVPLGPISWQLFPLLCKFKLLVSEWCLFILLLHLGGYMVSFLFKDQTKNNLDLQRKKKKPDYRIRGSWVYIQIPWKWAVWSWVSLLSSLSFSCLFFKTGDYNAYSPGLAWGAKGVMSAENLAQCLVQRPTMDVYNGCSSFFSFLSSSQQQ